LQVYMGFKNSGIFRECLILLQPKATQGNYKHICANLTKEKTEYVKAPHINL